MSDRAKKLAAAMSERDAVHAEMDAEDEVRNAPVPPDHEQRAYQVLLKEAKAAGSVLAGEGKGGLPSSLVLGVMRRDGFRCKACGNLGTRDKPITIHHVGGIVSSKWLSKQGHKNQPQNIVTLCTKSDANGEGGKDGTNDPGCHDKIHDRAREDGTDSSQRTPEGDIGTRRDHGLPVGPPE